MSGYRWHGDTPRHAAYRRWADAQWTQSRIAARRPRRRRGTNGQFARTTPPASERTTP